MLILNLDLKKQCWQAEQQSALEYKRDFTLSRTAAEAPISLLLPYNKDSFLLKIFLLLFSSFVPGGSGGCFSTTPDVDFEHISPLLETRARGWPKPSGAHTWSLCACGVWKD